VPEERKVWIENRLRWLQRQFGTDRVTVPTLVPTLKIFPRVWHGTSEECAGLFQDLCEYMAIPAKGVRLSLYQGTQDPLRRHLPTYESSERGAAGMYHGQSAEGIFIVSIASEQLQRPASLVATVCHELGHVLLLGGQKVKHDEPDHEPLTDLLTVYFGAGIFTANSAFTFEQWQDNRTQGWRASRHGYLDEPELAYALACYAWLRGESNPAWRRHLEPNIGPFFNDALHFLKTSQQTGLLLDVPAG